MSDADHKKLSELKVVELRSELEKRGLDRTGVKQVLFDRLSKALTDEGNDPETFVFDVNEEAADNKVEEKATEEKQDNVEESTDAEKIDIDAAVDGHESPIRLTLEDDEAIQEVENDPPETSEDKKTDEDASSQENTKQADESAEKNKEQSKDEDSSKTADNKLQKKVAKSNPNVLWISNVARNTRASELKAALSACGKVVGAKVVVNAKFPGSSCFGYVTMDSVEDVETVIAKLNNTELNGQIIKIDRFDLVRAEQMKQMSTGKDGHSEKKEGDNGDIKDGERKGVHRSRARSRQNDSSIKSGDRAKSSSSKGRKNSKDRTARPSRREDLLTFEKIKAERERQRLRRKEFELREEARRRQEEDARRREAERRQRIERERLDREKEKLRIEREKIEREKAELVRMERERQKLERAKIAMEKMELERTLLRMGEDRKATKRPATYHDSYDNRKRSASDRHFEAPPPPSISSRQGSSSGGGGSRLYERDSRSSRGDMDGSSRGKDTRYDRDHGSHFRPSARDDRRPVPDGKSNMNMGRYESVDSSSRYDRSANSWPPRPTQNAPVSGVMSQKWPKEQWRQEPLIPDRWQTASVPSRPYSGMNNTAVCPPPPGMSSYPDSRFNSGMRKY